MAAPLPSNGTEPTPAPADTVGDAASTYAGLSIVGQTMSGSPHVAQQTAPARNGKSLRPCPFCYSTDTMEPFRRSPRVAFLSRILPRLRWRYCRSCTRHFLTFARREIRH